MEGFGIFDAVGEAIEDIKVDSRVGYVMGPPAVCANQRVYPVERLVILPNDISDMQAAGKLLKWLTVSYLIYRYIRFRPARWSCYIPQRAALAQHYMRAHFLA